MPLFDANNDNRLNDNEEVLLTLQVSPWGEDDKHFLDIVLIHSVSGKNDRYKAIEWNGDTYPDVSDYDDPDYASYDEDVQEDYSSIDEIKAVLEELGHTVQEV